MDKAWHGQIPQKPRVLYVLLSPYMCVQLCMLKPLSGTWEASWLFSSFDSKRKWLEILILLTKISKYRSTQCAIPEDQLNIHDKLQVYRLIKTNILIVFTVHNDDLMDTKLLNEHLSISFTHTHTKRGQQHDLVRYDLLSILPQSPLFLQQHPLSEREREMGEEDSNRLNTQLHTMHPGTLKNSITHYLVHITMDSLYCRAPWHLISSGLNIMHIFYASICSK